MMRQNFKDWADREFGYPIPQEYLSFLEKGEPEPAGRKYYVTMSLMKGMRWKYQNGSRRTTYR